VSCVCEVLVPGCFLVFLAGRGRVLKFVLDLSLVVMDWFDSFGFLLGSWFWGTVVRLLLYP